jgi:two-component system response regulator LytT
MKVIIIEDEAAAYKNIRHILNQIDPTIEILANLDTVVSSVNWLRKNPQPDLIFMDIQLADGSSFNIFEVINVEAPVIFTTAYDEFAINAFRVNSIDYLLKPISVQSVTRALEKFKRVNQISLNIAIRNADKMLRPAIYSKRILIQHKEKILPIKIESIAYFYNTEGTTHVSLMDSTKYKIDKSLDSIVDTLDPHLFNRANRQFVLSKNAIEDITVWSDNRLLVNLYVEVPENIFVSKNRAAEFKSWFSV